MEGKLELTDPEQPEAKEAAEATARLLIDVHEKQGGGQGDRDDESSETNHERPKCV